MANYLKDQHTCVRYCEEDPAQHQINGDPLQATTMHVKMKDIQPATAAIPCLPDA